MLQLQVDQLTGNVSTWTNSSLQRVGRKWPGTIPVDVRFTKGAIVGELGTAAVGEFILRRISDGKILSKADSWAKSGIGAAAFYRFTIVLFNEDINPIFAADESVKVIAAEAEIRYLPGDGVDERSVTLKFDVWRGLLTGNEGVPAPAFAADARYVRRTSTNIRFLEDGTPQLFNPDTATWHTLSVRSVSGGLELVIGDGVSDSDPLPDGNGEARISSDAALELKNIDTGNFHKITIRNSVGGGLEISIADAA